MSRIVGDMTGLPRYVSHKIVAAGLIIGLVRWTQEDWTKNLCSPGQIGAVKACKVSPTIPGIAWGEDWPANRFQVIDVPVPPSFCGRGEPVPGASVLVEYGRDWLSWSPLDTFLEGYSPEVHK